MVDMLGSNSRRVEAAAPTKPAAPTTLSQKEGTVERRRRKSPASVNKIQRSDDSAKASESKRLCPEGILASLSSKPKLQVVVIYRTDTEGKIIGDNWLILEKSINQALHDAMCRPVNPFLAKFDVLSALSLRFGSHHQLWMIEPSLI